jgi:signal transduction histidine kinase
LSQQPQQPPPSSPQQSFAAQAPQGAPTGKAKRKAKNFMLQPLLQVKLGIYTILISVVFAAALAAILYFNFSSLINSIVLMTDAEEEVRDIFLSYWKTTQIWIYLTFLGYLVLTIVISVIYTHKLIGPTIAFRRHIRMIAEGRYNARTYLRKGDAFVEVAEELNRLSEVMERKAQGR